MHDSLLFALLYVMCFGDATGGVAAAGVPVLPTGPVLACTGVVGVPI